MILLLNMIMEKPASNKFSFNQRLRSFGFAIKGIIAMFKDQHNFWIQCAVAIAVIILGLLLNIGTTEWLFISLSIGFVLTAEMFNSVIEKLVDLVSPEFNKKAGLIKDIAAGAVLIAAITSAVIGLLIFVPRILQLL